MRLPVDGRTAVLGGAVLVSLLIGVGIAAGPPLPDGVIGTDGSRPNVVLIGVDRLRTQNVQCYGYHRNTTEHICALAANGTRFSRAYAQGTWTLPSVATLLTSRYPAQHGVADLDDRLPNDTTTVAETLRREGYSTAAFLGNTGERVPGTLYPGLNFGQGFDTYGSEGTFLAYNVPAALDWLDASGEEPFFLYVQGYEPHRYAHANHYRGDGPASRIESRYLERFAGNYSGILHDETVLERYGNPIPHLYWNETAGYHLDADGEPPHRLDPADVQHIRDHYDATVAHADHRVGQLIDGLRDRGVYDDTLVIVYSSHGEVWEPESLTDETGERVYFHGSTSDSVLHVPLIVRWPRGTGATPDSGDPVGLVDVMPSILEWAGIGSADGDAIQGEPIGGRDGDRFEYAHTELGNRWVAWSGDWKLVRNPAGTTREHVLYNISVPIRERQDVLDDHPAAGRELIDALEAHRLRVLQDR